MIVAVANAVTTASLVPSLYGIARLALVLALPQPSRIPNVCTTNYDGETSITNCTDGLYEKVALARGVDLASRSTPLTPPCTG